jgi:hypothetical protein
MSGQPVTGSAYGHISSNSSGTLKSSPGSLFNVTINSKGGSSNVLTLYDNIVASGKVIAVIDTTTNVGVLNYDLDFATGLSYTMGTGTAADVTVSYS